MALPLQQLPVGAAAFQNPLAGQFLPGLGAAPAAAPAATGPPTLVQQMMMGGFPMEKFTLIALTLFPPTGIAGLNLQAVQNTVGALLKVGSYVFTSLYAIRLMAMYPGVITKALSAALFLGPWYLYDSMNILFNPDFSREGFQPPVPIPGYPPPAPTDGRWLLTPILLSLIAATLPAGALGLSGIVNQFSPGAITGDTQKYMSYAVAGTAGLGVLFSLFSANKAPATGTATPVIPAIPSMTGGGRSLPPLSSFAKDLMRSTSPQAFQESLSFLGILGIIVGGGILLSITRNAAANAARPSDSVSA
jgi:hypothetical protein